MIELLLEAERALSFGRSDRAEALYRQVAAADPGNSIAVVGLARVALERDDDSGALVLARQALEIDAANVAAQRLVERLEEVLRTRGEALPVRPHAGPAIAATAGPTEPPAEPPAERSEAGAGPSEPSEATVTRPRRRTILDRIRGR